MFDVYSGSEVISSMFTRDRVYLIFCGWVDKFHPDWDVEKAGRWWDNQSWRLTTQEGLKRTFGEDWMQFDFPQIINLRA